MLMLNDAHQFDSLRGENGFASFTIRCIAILTFSVRQNVAHGCYANLLLFTTYMDLGLDNVSG